MKTILTFSASLLFFIVSSQTSINPKVIELDSTLTKSEIYKGVKLYLAETYKDFAETVQLDDPSQGILLIKGASENYTIILGSRSNQGWWYYTVKFEVKDGKYRFSVYDIHCINTHNQTIQAENATGFYKTRLKELITELDNNFSNIPITKTSTDDW